MTRIVNFEGRKISVPDDATDDEVAQILDSSTPAPAPPATINPDTMQPAGVPEFKPVGVDGYDPKTGLVDKMGAAGTFAAAMPEGVPIAGPLLDKAATAASAGIGSLISGDPYAKVKGEMQRMKDAGNEAHPVAQMGGNLAGALATLGPIGATEAGGWALGTRGASLGGRSLMSAVSGAGISGADTAARGGDLGDIATSTAVGGGLGGILPGAGALIKGGVGGASEWLSRIINSAKNPASEAERRLGTALSRDAAANPTGTLGAVDETVAQDAGIPLTNVDRGGETTRALARSAGNQSPEARASIEKTASDRFGGQSYRASEYVTKIMGGKVDDLGYQQAVRDTAARVNGPAYNKAFAQPAAQAMDSPELMRLMSAPAVQDAVAGAETRGANRAVIEGFKPVKNPFVTDQAGNVTLRDPNVKPTLQFWDQTKRNLDGAIGKAKMSGDKTLVGDLTALKTELVKTLDAAVPEYQAARQGAASFFGAEDALDAGRQFFRTPRGVPEAKKAYLKFTPFEREAFSTGYASELIDRIKDSPDRMNVINSVFKNQAKRESIELAMGPDKARKLEAYVRVEDLVDRLRGAMGNSTTARQLAELGIGATAGGVYTGDWTGALTGAALVGGPRLVRDRLEQNVMKELGKLLTADDPAMVQRLITNAAASPKYMQALDKIGGMLAAPARVGIVEANQPGQ